MKVIYIFIAKTKRNTINLLMQVLVSQAEKNHKTVASKSI